MATTGTSVFDMDFTEIAEEAWERAGREMRTGYDLRTARRSMNLMTIEWQNRGINMWTIDEGSVALAEGTAEYDLPADTIDVMEVMVRTGSGDTQVDRPLSRVSVSTYAGITNKTLQGPPLNVFVRRLRANPTVVLWPVPDQGTLITPVYTLRYWRMRRIQDAGNGVETPDIGFRFLPAMCAGLAYHIATKTPDLADRIDMLKQQYDEQYNLAAGEDREKATLRLHPRIY
jgi:hypothetical protein